MPADAPVTSAIRCDAFIWLSSGIHIQHALLHIGHKQADHSACCFICLATLDPRLYQTIAHCQQHRTDKQADNAKAEQAASLQESSASLEELSSMTKRNADNASSAKEAAAKEAAAKEAAAKEAAKGPEAPKPAADEAAAASDAAAMVEEAQAAADGPREEEG